jgi:hypothetical protein
MSNFFGIFSRARLAHETLSAAAVTRFANLDTAHRPDF